MDNEILTYKGHLQFVICNLKFVIDWILRLAQNEINTHFFLFRVDSNMKIRLYGNRF